MGVVTYESETTTSIPPARIFKAVVLEADTIIPKVMPHAIKSAEIVEGDGGPGTIKKITFGEGSQLQYVLHKIEAVDKENLTFSYSIIEGGALMDNIEKISHDSQFVASADGGCIVKSTDKYYTKGDVEIKEEEIKAGKEKAMGLFKAVEAYLLANPDA